MNMLKNNRSRILLAACGGALTLAGLGTTGTATAARFAAVLSGKHQVQSPGDDDGWGRIKIRVDDGLDQICADLEVRSVGEVTGAQIYRGGPGENGTPVVKLDTPDDNDSEDCDFIGDALADEIQANPSGFYVNVTTREFPSGALRGQLGPGG